MQSVLAGREMEPDAASLEKGPLGLYTGWYNVLLSLAIITFVVGSTNYSFGLFVRPASEALGLTRAEFNLGMSAFLVGIAAFSPIMGRLLDRFPAIPIGRACAALFAFTMFAISQTETPWLIMVLLVGPLAMATVGCGGLFGTVMVSRWFTDLRGRALSIMWMGTSFGGMLVVPINALLLSLLGWQMAIAAIGLMVGTFVILLTFFIKPQPDARTEAYLKSQDPGHQPGMSWQQVLAQRDFWMIVLPVTLMLSVDQTILATTTPFALDRGMSLAQAASLMSALTASAIVGKIVIAWIADRADLRLLLAVTAIFGAAQCMVLAFDPSYELFLVVCLMTGLAVGGTMPLSNIILSYRFGGASIGTVMGLQMPITLMMSMSLLYFVGAVHDRDGSYTFAFWVFSAMFAASILVVPFIRYRVAEDATAEEAGLEATA